MKKMTKEAWIVMSKDKKYVATVKAHCRMLTPVELKDATEVITYKNIEKAIKSIRHGYINNYVVTNHFDKTDMEKYLEPVKVDVEIKLK